jgi:hypothetical protein
VGVIHTVVNNALMNKCCGVPLSCMRQSIAFVFIMVYAFKRPALVVAAAR